MSIRRLLLVLIACAALGMPATARAQTCGASFPQCDGTCPPSAPDCVATGSGCACVAASGGPNTCLAGKNKCASKKMQGKLKCHYKAEKSGGPVDPACLQKATDKFDGGTKGFEGSCFGKLEIKYDFCTGGGNDGGHCNVASECPSGTCTVGCLTNGDLAAIENKVDAFVTDVVTELDLSFPAPVQDDCSAGKKKCVLKKAAWIMKCYGKAAKGGGPVDPACVQKARDKYDGGIDPTRGCFAKLEAKLPCLTTGDSTDLENKVDAFIQDVLCELGYTTLNCAMPTPTVTPTP